MRGKIITKKRKIREKVNVLLISFSRFAEEDQKGKNNIFTFISSAKNCGKK